VTYTSIDDPALTPAEELTSQQLAARMIQLPCDAGLVAQSENTFFSGAEHIQFVGQLDCFVQVKSTLVDFHSQTHCLSFFVISLTWIFRY
jgi:hypothetical protein